MKCPKCGYERTPKDNLNTPVYECPACGIIYTKFQANQSETKSVVLPHKTIFNQKMRTRDIVLSVIVAAFMLLGVYGSISEIIERDQADSHVIVNTSRQVNPQKSVNQAKRSDKKIDLKMKVQQRKLDCRRDVNCVGMSMTATVAGIDCIRKVEASTRFRYKWKDSWLDSKFSGFAWNNAAKTQVLIAGDKLEIQNAFGGWQKFNYGCVIDIDNEKLLNIYIQPKR